MSGKPTRWGIIGTSSIASKFATELAGLKQAELTVVASRSAERAREFAGRHAAARAVGSIDALLECPVDAVYVATPSRLHAEHCLKVLEHDRAVLCEKPLAVSKAEVESVFAKAQARGVFCMEAMWMRFNPYVQELKQRLQAGELGDVHHMHACLGYRKGEERVKDPNSGRGALLDFGVYPLSLAHYLFGPPQELSAKVRYHALGGDETATALLGYVDGTCVTVTASARAYLSNSAVVCGSRLTASLLSPLLSPRGLEVDEHPSAHGLLRTFAKKAIRRAATRHKASPTIGFRREAEEVMRCLASGKLQSDVVPHDATLCVLDCVERIRRSG